MILWVSLHLYLTGGDQTLPLTNLRITSQSLAWLMLAAEAGGTKIGQLAMTRLGDGSKHGLFLGAFSFLVALAICNSRCPLRMILLPKEMVVFEENMNPVQNLPACRPPPLSSFSFFFV